MSRVEAVAAARGGPFTGTEAVALGADPTLLRQFCQGGHAVRLRRNAYVLADVWAEADYDERSRLTAKAILLGRPGSVASHHTAVLLHGLPLWDRPIRTFVVAPVTRSWLTAMLHVHPGAEEVNATSVDGYAVVPVALALAQVAASDSIAHAVVPFDAALHRELVTRQQVVEVRGLDVDRAMTQRVLALADKNCESVGETRTRLLLKDLGFRVASQVEIRDSRGVLLGRVDFLVEGKVVVEFDGAVKYDGDGGRDALIHEKVREDGLRAEGYPFVRVMWADFDDPAAIRTRVLHALHNVA